MNKLVAFGVLIAISTSIQAAEFKPDAYKELDTKTVKTMPQDFKNKKVKISPVFRKFASPTPDYIEKQFDDRKYAVIISSPNEWGLPIIAKKSGDLGEKVLAIQENSDLIVYGRVKKFRSKPKGHKRRTFSKAPEYYIELQHIEVTQPTTNDGRGNNSKQERKTRKRERKF